MAVDEISYVDQSGNRRKIVMSIDGESRPLCESHMRQVVEPEQKSSSIIIDEEIRRMVTDCISLSRSD